MSIKSWYEEKQEPHRYLWPYLKQLDNNQSYIQDSNIKFMRLYGNQDYRGNKLYSGAADGPSYSGQNRITLNIIQSMVDTAHAKITKNKPLPYFLTSEGDFSLQRRAEKLSQFVEGQFYATDMFAIMPAVS